MNSTPKWASGWGTFGGVLLLPRQSRKGVVSFGRNSATPSLRLRITLTLPNLPSALGQSFKRGSLRFLLLVFASGIIIRGMDLSGIITKHPVRIVGGTIVFLFTVLGFARNAEWFGSKFDQLVTKGVVIVPGQAAVQTRLWFFLSFVLLVCAVAALLLLYLRSELMRREVTRNRDERRTVAFKTLMGMMRAASRIRDRIFPPARKPLKSFRSIKAVFNIHSNFDTEVREEYEIYSSDEPVHFLSLVEGVTDAADPVEYLDDINFKVIDNSGHEVVYLPTENDGRLKRVVLYFLPRIEPREDPRKIVVSYRWPGMAKQLDLLGEEDYSWEPTSRDPIALLEYSIFSEPGTKRVLACELAGPSNATETLSAVSNDKGWEGFCYKIENSPGGRCALTVKLRYP